MQKAMHVLIGVTMLACTQPTRGEDTPAIPPTSPSQPVTTPPSKESEWAAIERLETEAKVLAKTGGCASAEGCRAAPVGSRACGGPRYYIAYCAATTDSVALFRKLDQVAAAEQAYNKKYEIVSTCEFRTPPALELVGGVCRASTR